MARYLKPITLRELETLWGIEVLLPLKARGQNLYLRIKKDGSIHEQGGGSFVCESELKATDKVML
jgi:hypothetical protein